MCRQLLKRGGNGGASTLRRRIEKELPLRLTQLAGMGGPPAGRRSPGAWVAEGDRPLPGDDLPGLGGEVRPGQAALGGPLVPEQGKGERWIRAWGAVRELAGGQASTTSVSEKR